MIIKSYDMWTKEEKEIDTNLLKPYKDKKAKGKITTDKNGYIVFNSYKQKTI